MLFNEESSGIVVDSYVVKICDVESLDVVVKVSVIDSDIPNIVDDNVFIGDVEAANEVSCKISEEMVDVVTIKVSVAM